MNAVIIPFQDITHEQRLARSAGVGAPSTALSAMNAGNRRLPRQRDLSHVQRERDEAGAALASLQASRPLSPPKRPDDAPPLPLRHEGSSAGAHVLQQELRRGIVGKRRPPIAWEYGS